MHRLADGTGAHEGKHEVPLRFAAVLETSLEILRRIRLGGLGNRLGIGRRAAERGLAVNVFAGLERGLNDVLMVMRGRGDDYALDIFVL